MINKRQRISLKNFGSAEEIFMFENWFESTSIIGPKFLISLKNAYLCYESYVKNEGREDYKLPKKRFKAFVEDMLEMKGIEEPIITSGMVYIKGFDVKPELKKLITQQKNLRTKKMTKKKKVMF